jgi:hypothetical protein
VLKAHVEMPDQKRREFGPGYHDHEVLFCWGERQAPAPRHHHPPVQAAGGGGLEADRQVANTLAGLIIGGTLASTEIG